jgi:hypothetical protein
VGVPLIVPVLESKTRPLGRLGLTENEVTDPLVIFGVPIVREVFINDEYSFGVYEKLLIFTPTSQNTSDSK